MLNGKMINGKQVSLLTLSDAANKSTLENIEFENVINVLIGSYSNLSDDAKTTIRQLLSTPT